LEVGIESQSDTLGPDFVSRYRGFGAMSPESRNAPEQEISIKARAHEVFAEKPRPESRKSSRPFPVILRETPAEPLSALTKAMLWIAGVIVAVLFLAAIWRVTTRHGPKRQIEAVPVAEKSAMSAAPPNRYRILVLTHIAEVHPRGPRRP
jgi:hypothetical protein